MLVSVVETVVMAWTRKWNVFLTAVGGQTIVNWLKFIMLASYLKIYHFIDFK